MGFLYVDAGAFCFPGYQIPIYGAVCQVATAVVIPSGAKRNRGIYASNTCQTGRKCEDPSTSHFVLHSGGLHRLNFIAERKSGNHSLGCKKSREKSLQKWKSPLTNGRQWCKMELHTVGVCDFHAFPFCTSILPQEMVAVKKNVDYFWQRYLAYRKHTIRKKGCDDPYGTGQGPNVWQDHA